MSDNVSLELLSRQIDRVLSDVRQVKADDAQLLDGLTVIQDSIASLDHRLSGVKDELVLAIKLELRRPVGE